MLQNSDGCSSPQSGRCSRRTGWNRKNWNMQGSRKSCRQTGERVNRIVNDGYFFKLRKCNWQAVQWYFHSSQQTDAWMSGNLANQNSKDYNWTNCGNLKFLAHSWLLILALFNNSLSTQFSFYYSVLCSTVLMVWTTRLWVNSSKA